MTLTDTRSATSLQASGAGVLPCNLQDGLQIDLFGQAPVPVSPSRLPERVKAQPTTDTSGPTYSGLSASVVLPLFSENKSPMPSVHRQRLTRTCRKCGINQPYSEFYANSKGNRRWTCKSCTKDTELLRKRDHAQQVSASQKAWRDENRGHALVNVAKHRAKMKGLCFGLDPMEIQARIDSGVCELTGIAFDLTVPHAWNAPSLDRIDSSQGYTMDNVRVVLYALNVMANKWGPNKILEIATAIRAKRTQASDNLSSMLGLKLQKRLATHGSMEYRQTWKVKVTPAGRRYWAHTASAHRISDSGCFGWATPSTRDWKDTGDLEKSRYRKNGKERNDTLSRQIAIMRGYNQHQSDTQGIGHGVLNPEFTCWLMGFPAGWDEYAVTATP